MPSVPLERRELHSEEWFECKKKEAKDIYRLIEEYEKLSINK
jgi:hypothetical protein